jgi:ABC-type uncharacterized transport system substrate-binding protein
VTTRHAALVVAIAAGLLAAPFAVEAQQRGKVYRVGILRLGEADAPQVEAFRQGLRELGHVEGQNLAIEIRAAGGKAERLPGLAAELVGLGVDVIFTSGAEATLRAASDATSAIPIVVVAVDYDPVALGYAAGLRRPGGNVTGVLCLPLICPSGSRRSPEVFVMEPTHAWHLSLAKTPSVAK